MFNKKPRKLPPLELVQANFDYDPVTGELIRKKTGTPVRCNDRSTGQMKVRCGSAVVSVQRICWFLFYREDPVNKQIRHIDGNPFNNAIDNLTAVKLR